MRRGVAGLPYGIVLCRATFEFSFFLAERRFLLPDRTPPATSRGNGAVNLNAQRRPAEARAERDGSRNRAARGAVARASKTIRQF